MGRARDRRLLQAASDGGVPVRLVRTLEGADRIDGFVVGLAAGWVLVHQAPGLRLDGWSAIRLDTVREVERAEADDILVRALGAHDHGPESIAVDLAGPAEIIRSMARLAPLVTLHREARWPDECYIGVPVHFTAKQVALLELDPQAHWDPTPRTFGLRKLTRIGIGADYERTLHLVGGPPPDR